MIRIETLEKNGLDFETELLFRKKLSARIYGVGLEGKKGPEKCRRLVFGGGCSFRNRFPWTPWREQREAETQFQWSLKPKAGLQGFI